MTTKASPKPRRLQLSLRPIFLIMFLFGSFFGTRQILQGQMDRAKQAEIKAQEPGCDKPEADGDDVDA